MATWLPRAIEDPSSDSALAVNQIARRMQRDHFDNWWANFLKTTRSTDLPAVRALSAAFVDAENDLHYQALKESRVAAKEFASGHNLPGKLLAQFEEVYVLQRILSSDVCLARATRLWTELTQTEYRWLQGQLALEMATCANLVSDFKVAAANIEKSREIARKFQYPELLLRVNGIEAGMQRLRGKYDSAWKEGVEGLRAYWQGSYSAARLYQFYAVMRQCAKDSGSLHTAEALLRQSIQVLEDDAPDDLGLRALLYLRLASLLEQFHDPAAEIEANKAKDLLNRIPIGESAAQTYVAAARIELADFELRRHAPQTALSLIEPVKSTLFTYNDFVALDYYRVLGTARLKMNQLEEATLAFQEGIKLAERSLDGLEDDTSRSHWIRITDEIYRGLVQTLLAKQDNVAALAVWEQSKSRWLQSWRDGDSTNSGTGVSLAAPLPPVSEPHLVYASFEDHLQFWVMNGSQIQSGTVSIKQVDLEQLVHEFAELCANPDSSQSETARKAQELYTLLLQPAIGHLTASSEVTFELDQTLAPLPMEALENQAGRYFGDDYIVSYSPGLLASSALRRPLPLKASDHFLVVDASPSSGSRYLPGHELATSAINQSHSRTTIMDRGDTTLARVKEELSTSVAFHFTGHGERDGTGTALELGPNSFLRARDLSPPLLRRLRLAVLAACSSGSGENGLLDNDNLVRALLVAGVPRIIASHWNVDSKSTGQLMKRFYLHLTSEPAAAALRDASREIRQEKAAPYYWAAFCLTGRTN